MVSRFGGKGVVVTGAAGGIGGAIAARLAGEGAALFLLDIAVPAAPPAMPGAAGVAWAACDVADEAAIADVTRWAEGELDSLDALINVAGAMIYRSLPELSAADWHGSLAVNLIGAALLTGWALRRMADGGAIVNVASVHAKRTSALVAPYAAAKAGLCSLSRSAAVEGASRRIRANTLLPGAIDTPMLRGSPTIASGAERLAPGDVGSPADVAAAAAFLASDEARFINGAELLIEGGRLARL